MFFSLLNQPQQRTGILQVKAMRLGTQSSMRNKKATIERGKNCLELLHKEQSAEHCNNAIDRISELSDDILISIISQLTLREATATNILSTRWRHLCTSTTRLDFPPFYPETGPLYEYLEEIQEKRFPNYINLINHTLDSHKGGRVLKEFRVHMYCLEGANIERWLEFALAREVEIIDIQMRYLINATHGYYTLGLSNLIGGRLLLGLKCLKHLSLSVIHVDDGEVELLLSNFPRLESLSIAHSEKLKNVLVVGHPLLNHLDISHALNIESIEISHMINLISLRCYELPSTYLLKLHNVPMLTEFQTSDKRNNTLAEILPRIPSCIHDQLRRIKLSTDTSLIDINLPIPELINVKHLELEVHMYTYSTINRLFPLIEACRSLEKLDIKLLWRWIEPNFEDGKIWVRFPRKTLSPNLKKLKLSGYLGCPSEVGFALSIIKNAVALEEFVVEPCDETCVLIPRDETDHEILRMATARASEHLRPITPKSVNLIIMGTSQSASGDVVLFPLVILNQFLQFFFFAVEKICDVSSSFYKLCTKLVEGVID